MRACEPSELARLNHVQCSRPLPPLFCFSSPGAERAMNHLEKLFVIKRLNQESDCADLHREDPRGSIFVSCDYDHMSPR